MLLFIPVASRLEADYTDEQRIKFLFNHMTYIGDQDCIAILGLADLDNKITLKDGSIITVCTLLKSLPACPGMSRNRLFQVVDPASTPDHVIVMYQQCDKMLVEDRKFTLEAEILSHLAPGQAALIFTDEFEGISFVDAFHKNKGKVVRIHQPTKSHQDFVKHADSILSSPPKKRPFTTEVKLITPTPLQPIQVNKVTYSRAVQAQTTRTRSVVQPDGTRTSTTTQMLQTVMASMETRFQVIEKEQLHLKHRITGVENKAANISDNIQTMMQHWKITPVNYKRKPEGETDGEEDMEDAHHSIPSAQGQGDNYF
jgi:hypothetical protein